ncbi:MAG: DUF748 domain-containing protein [Bacteroidia bacterium]
MKTLKKIILFFLLLAAVVFTLLYFSLSPIAKYEIEKNSVKWTGRKITAGSIKIRVFNGSVYIKDLHIYEANSDKVFFDCHDIYLKVNLKKILARVYKIDEIKIDAPEISIIQDGNKFNFDDLLKRFLPGPGKETEPAKTTETYYYISKVIINNGSVTYNNVPIHNVFKIHNINFNLPEISWNKPESKVHLDFKYGIGGFFNIDLDANRKTFDYNLSLRIDSYDLSQYYAPLNSLVKISSFNGLLSAKLRMHGKFNNPKEFSLAGFLQLNNVEVKDTADKKLFALGEFSISADTINVKNGQYIFHHIIADKPYIVFNDYPEGNNFSRMIKYKESPVVKDTSKGKTKLDYSNIFTLLASSFKATSLNFLNTSYHADSVAIHNGQFVFNDNTPDNKFHYTVSNINIDTKEIGTNTKSVLFSASAILNDTGKFNMNAGIRFDLKKKIFDYKITTLGISHISPIVKYVIEKNDVKWIGRQVTIGGIKINALNGSVKVKNIKIYEANSDKVFFDCHDIYLKVNLDKMFSGIYGIDTIKIDEPEISIIQDGNKFNFDDLKKRFSSDTSKKKDTNAPATRYSVTHVIINNGNITYNNVPIHNMINIHNINFNLPEISWNNDKSKAHLDFKYGVGGFFNIDLDANRKTLDYYLSLLVDNYDLSQYYAPLNTLINISLLKGRLSTNLRIHGNFNNPKDISTVGYLHLSDVELKDSAKEKVFALGELAINIDTVNIRHNLYTIDNILLDKPFLRFDYFPNGNNISGMLKYSSPPGPVTDNTTGEVKPDYSNIFTLLSSSVKLMAVDFFNTNYHTDSITIHNGQLAFSDYTLNRPFHYNVSNINLTTDEISAKSKNIVFNASATLNDTGKFTMYADISLDLKNMLLNYNVSNLRLSDFNPYSEYYVGTPFWGGYMRYQSTDSVINRNLKSTNIIHIEGLRVGKKVANKPVYNIPVHMAVALLKDEKGNIDLTLPASGNLDDPNYKMGRMIWPIISDLVKKTAESPVKLLAKLFNWNPEEMKQFNFDYLQDKLAEKQYHKLDDITKVLNRKKEIDVEITQVIDSLEEKDELALSLAKKQYFLDTKHILNDSLLSNRKKRKESRASGKIATQDTLFDKYLNEKLQLTGNELMTIEDKCIMFEGDTLLNKKIHDLIESRNRQVMEFLTDKKNLSPKRVKVAVNKDSLKIQELSQPEFEINYIANETEEDK